MRAGVTGILELACLVIAYLALLWLGKRFFIGRYRAETAAAAAVVAFSVGIYWPRPEMLADRHGSEKFSDAATPDAAPIADAGRDVSAACLSARISINKGRGHIDSIAVQHGNVTTPLVPNERLRKGDILVMGGWAANPDLTGSANAVCIVADGKILPGIKVIYGVNRPDVATAFKNDTLMPTGFEITLPAGRLLHRAHRVQAASVTAGGEASLLSGGIQISGPLVSGS